MNPYSEQVGVKRQHEGKSGEMAARENVIINTAVLQGRCFMKSEIVPIA